MPDELDDFQILLQRVCDGSEEAAWELVEKYGDHIRRAVRRSLDARLRSKFDSLDFVQLVWSSFFRARGRAQRFNHPGELVAFLRTMARNKVGMETRRRLNTQKFNVGRERSLDALPDHDDLAPASREETPVATAIAREQWNRIMQDHPEHYQEIIRMRLQGHTCTGIADSLGLSERTVRRFLKKLCRDSQEQGTEGGDRLMSRATADIEGVQSADRLAAEVRDRWHRGEEADVSAILQEWPGLEQHRSVVLDLAYHEYIQRLDRGESLSADQFSRRFPSLQRSLFMLIQVRQMLSRDSGIQTLEHDVAWPETGESFLGFRLLAELGRGTFGRVFLASEPALGDRLVALKVALGGDEEAEMLGRLRHANVVPIHSIRKDPSSTLTAICMPYHGRTTLCDILDAAFLDRRLPTRARVVVETVESLHDKSELPPENRIDRILRNGSYVDGMIHLAIQLSDALAYAHAKGICHRDLKPSNVLISHECRPLLLDFNLSFDDQRGASRIGGTLPYMAPEQLAAIAGDFDVSPSLSDQRSDLFSLGVIFYELLAGTLPFGPVQWASSFQQTAQLLLDQQACGPKPLREKNRLVDRRLADTVEKCLAFDPDDRPASAVELADSLRKELRPTRRAKRWIRSHRKTATAFAIVLATIVVALGVFLATREPYHVRQLQRGRAYVQRGEYDPAIEAFDAAVQSAPDPSEALFERGRARAKSGDYRGALEDLGASYKLRPTPEAAIGRGYCLNRLKYYKEAIVAYCEAGETGQSSVAVLNNIGHSCLCVRDLDGAERALTEAARLDPNQQAVQYNLAILCLRYYRIKRPIPPDAYSHAARALELGSPDSELCRLAATFCVIDPSADSQGVASALTYLERGVSLGLDMAILNSDPVFRPLKDEPMYKQLMNKPRGRKVAESNKLIDPLQIAHCSLSHYTECILRGILSAS